MAQILYQPPEDEQWNQKMEELFVENEILLYTQPPNSPDLDINEMGSFSFAVHIYAISLEGPEDIIPYI